MRQFHLGQREGGVRGGRNQEGAAENIDVPHESGGRSKGAFRRDGIVLKDSGKSARFKPRLIHEARFFAIINLTSDPPNVRHHGEPLLASPCLYLPRESLQSC